MKTIVRWGILGTASIARRQAIPAMQASPYAKAVAIGSRSLERAQECARMLGIPAAYGSYEQVLAAGDVDAVYIPLPNDQHLPWIERAVQAGKHVLCEKPLGLDAGQIRRVQQVVAAASKVQVMEGISSHFHPVHHQVVTWIRHGLIGEPVVIRASLGWSFRDRPRDYRWQRRHGGGALLDLGGYLIYTARLLAGTEPIRAMAKSAIGAGDVDVNTAVMLAFPQATALLDCGLMSASRNVYEVIGTEGRIIVDRPFGNRATERTIRLFDEKGELLREEAFTAHQFQREIDEVSKALIQGSPLPIPLAESLANARVLDACWESIRTGAPVDLAPSP